MAVKFNLKRGIILPLFFFTGFTFSALAQQTDTTSQKPVQLNTTPPAGPTLHRPVPVVVPDTLNRNLPARKSQQEPEEKESILKKMFLGGHGDLGFQSSAYYGTVFNIGFSPLLGFRLTKFLAIGPGLVYQYYSIGGNRSSNYGIKGFGQVSIYKSFFLHVEHSLVSTQDYYTDQQGQIIQAYRHNVGTTLAGGGYRQMYNDRIGMDTYILFPVGSSTATYNATSVPVFRVGVIYNLK